MTTGGQKACTTGVASVCAVAAELRPVVGDEELQPATSARRETDRSLRVTEANTELTLSTTFPVPQGVPKIGSSGLSQGIFMVYISGANKNRLGIQGRGIHFYPW